MKTACRILWVVAVAAFVATPIYSFAGTDNASQNASNDASSDSDQASKQSANAAQHSGDDSQSDSSSNSEASEQQDSHEATDKDTKESANSAQKTAGQTTEIASKQVVKGQMTASKLVKLAKKKAGDSYQSRAKVPKFLRQIDGTTYDQIYFKPSAALWHDANVGYRVRGQLPGMIYDHAVSIRRNTDDGTRPFRFKTDKFNWPSSKLQERVPGDLGYAGFSIDRRRDDNTRWWAVTSFLGASYFRARGLGQQFGSRARGVAINPASVNKKSFAQFTHFWLASPQRPTRDLTVYALLQSEKVVGAYVINIDPGRATHTHVNATLFTRKKIKKLGVAPLTSMFTRGENSLADRSNLRPEAHDADGLLVRHPQKGWQWRPLTNPAKLKTVNISADHVSGFGLMQRDRDYGHYRAPEQNYQNQPNVWISPDQGFDTGHLDLIQIPSDSEVNRNIELSWVPDRKIEANQKLEFSYDVTWSPYGPQPDAVGHVTATHIGHPSSGDHDDRVRVELEFAGGRLARLGGSDEVASQVTTARKIALKNVHLRRDTQVDGWQLSFEVPADALQKPLDIEAYLKNDQQKVLTETWTYTLVDR